MRQSMVSNRNASMTSPTSDSLVDDLVLCATNEGSFYDRFLRQALVERAAGPAPAAKAQAVRDWLVLAAAFLPIHARTSVRRPNATQRMAFALALASYYAEHLGEFDDAALDALKLRLEAA